MAWHGTTPMDNASALVETDWLAAHLAAPDVKIIDATYMAGARQAYAERHIPGAVYADIDAIADPHHDLPHTLPDGETFAAEIGALGVGDGHRVVLYDHNNYAAAARMWWLFRLYGHKNVAVLNGGMAKWLAEGRPVANDPVGPDTRHFTPRRDHTLARDLQQLLANIDTPHETVVDVRARERFLALVAEPRPGLRAGHIPGSTNLPYTEVIDPLDGTIKPVDSLRALLDEHALDLDRPIVVTCGSGVTACTFALALYQMGKRDVAIYDGSWTEWGGHPDTPVAR